MIDSISGDTMTWLVGMLNTTSNATEMRAATFHTRRTCAAHTREGDEGGVIITEKKKENINFRKFRKPRGK